LSASPLEEVLEKLRASAAGARDQGDKFERMMVRFFQTDVMWAERFDQVWLWMDWPGRPKQGDHGIDLVARVRETGDLAAIQCKFYDPAATIYKGEIDSFLSESGKHPFKERIVVTTTDHWGTNAEQAINNQQIPVFRLRFKDLADSSIDWSLFDLSAPETMTVKPRKQLRPHQSEALNAVQQGFGGADRGKLIMACGTGKTFTSLRVAERMVGTGGRVLFLVPSISLLSQSLTEWSVEADLPLRTFAVCSDTKVGKSAVQSPYQDPSEDIPVVDLALPATTDPAKLHARLSSTVAGEDKLTVVFSTYQSIDVIHQAQELGAPGFDLIICDEAHRTTGATLPGADESAFVRVHKDSYLRAAKRLYMTATPRIFDDSSKAKAGQADVVIASMDDEELFGPEFHRLGFGEAVSKGLLTDYKVLVLAVDEEQVSRAFQTQLAQDSELQLDDIAKIIGCWNGLAKRRNPYSDFGGDDTPMQRAVAFAGNIASSKKFVETFNDVVAKYIAEHEAAEDEEGVGTPLSCEAKHVDGTHNILVRNEMLDWLKGSAGPDTCRVLSNARCLSEGVDVPSLDAVMFLNPRKSVVDVVQSVGRVMRKAEGKQYGYIILPIGIPSNLTPEQALGDNKRYQVVWEVLQALRAHDDRFNAMVNKIDLNGDTGGRVQVIGATVPGGDTDDQDPSRPGDANVQPQLPLQWVDQVRDALYTKIVAKVGSRRYWEDWAKDIAVIAERHTTRIRAILSDPDSAASEQFARFLAGLRKNLNDSIDGDAAIDMLAQHMITRPVFEALFSDYAFAEHNPVSRSMQAMLDILDEHNVDSEALTLEKFYGSVRLRAEGIKHAEDRQKIITELYEKFFRNAFPQAAESLGIVYTPTEIVDFIIRSVNDILNAEFGQSLSDEGVHVLDPFTGTGTFVVRLLQSGLIRPEDIARKYAQELHANEILLLAYYIAAINIEAAYHGLTTGDEGESGEYEPFDGIVLSDTFHMTEDGGFEDHEAFPANSERAAAQRALDISVIIGNPPYSVGQTSGNDNNANLKYPHLDQAIAASYAARSTATNKNSLYDSYIRAFRWASDRIKDSGVVGFVSNGGFIDGNTADGLRKTFASEFTSIYVYNLRGNQRTAGELSRREGGKVFGGGSRNTVAITLLVKNPAKNGTTVLHYKDIGDYLSREQKLGILDDSDIASTEWTEICPNDAGDWINQRNDTFQAFMPIGDKDGGPGIFRTYSAGVKTNRDAWLYNSSPGAIERTVRESFDFYNAEVARYVAFCHANGISSASEHVKDFINRDPKRFSWNTADIRNMGLGSGAPRYSFDPSFIRVAAYRPFNKQRLYFDRAHIERSYQVPALLPDAAHVNIGIELTSPGSHYEFAPFITDCIPDLHLLDTGQFFPRYTYAEPVDDPAALFGNDLSAARVDNITDAALSSYRAAYGTQVSKDDIFHYVYGLLHSPDYRSQFAADLKKMLPRIPQVAAVDDFRAFVAAGTELAALHTNYERVRPYPLRIGGEAPADASADRLYDYYRVEKMRFGGKAPARDRSTVIYNSRITVSGIPDEAHEYLLGPRTGIEWVIERYQVKTDKASSIINDPNDWSREVGDPRYILDLLARVVTVSIETVRIVKSLPPLCL
jgi:predicted helicase